MVIPDNASLTKEIVQEVIDRCGDRGHSIFGVSQCEQWNVPDWVWKHLVQDHGGGGGKFDCTDNEGKVAILHGVYSLHVLSAVVGTLGLEHSHSIGRGSQARDYTDALNRWCASLEED